MIRVAKSMSPWGMVLRSVGVVGLAWLAMGWVYASMMAGDSARTFTGFVLLLFLFGLARSIFVSVRLVIHKRRLAALPAEMSGKVLSAVLANWKEKGDLSPFVGVISSAHDQFARNPAAVDTATLIEVLEDRLFRAGPQGTFGAASLSLTLGFLGTCFGLLMTMNGMSDVVASAGANPQEVTRGMFSDTGPLAGLGGAYLSTLAALACGSVVLRGLGSIQATAVADLVAEFREMVTVYVKPALRAPSRPRSRPKQTPKEGAAV